MHSSNNRSFKWKNHTANNLNTIKISYCHVRIRNNLIRFFIFLILENYSVKTHFEAFGSPLFSDSTAVSSNTFEVSNIHNCNNIGLYCLNAYWLFVALR